MSKAKARAATSRLLESERAGRGSWELGRACSPFGRSVSGPALGRLCPTPTVAHLGALNGEMSTLGPPGSSHPFTNLGQKDQQSSTAWRPEWANWPHPLSRSKVQLETGYPEAWALVEAITGAPPTQRPRRFQTLGHTQRNSRGPDGLGD